MQAVRITDWFDYTEFRRAVQKARCDIKNVKHVFVDYKGTLGRLFVYQTFQLARGKYSVFSQHRLTKRFAAVYRVFPRRCYISFRSLDGKVIELINFKNCFKANTGIRHCQHAKRKSLGYIKIKENSLISVSIAIVSPIHLNCLDYFSELFFVPVP